MTNRTSGRTRSPVTRRIWRTGCLCLLLVGCTGPSFQLAPIVPTKQQLPYSAQLRLVELAAYTVEPGATLRSDPQLQNYVTQTAATSFLSAKQWEQTVLDYMRARQTFRKVVEKGSADIRMDLRVFVYIDPGVKKEFNHTYIARADTLVTDPLTGGAVANYSGFGKATGPASNDLKEADEGLMRKSVRAALNDLFSKIETDKRLVSL